MQITRLTLSGFKSFVDKLPITLSRGKSVIVGPNGCGKSNIVDAIKWVLGEQSVKSLRGRQMEDVIFSGSETRASVNLAEVSLTLSNEDGKAPPPYDLITEITVTRRLFRGEESLYLINNAPCRRLDIKRLFMDTGLGDTPYGIIGQGEVAMIFESKPEELKSYLEEASGITRFRAGRSEALKRIELTSQNLLRVEDIIGELLRQLSRLKRQAKKAEEFGRLNREAKTLKAGLLAMSYLKQLGEEALLKERLSRIAKGEEDLGVALERVSAEITLKQVGLIEIEKGLEGAREELFSLKTEVSAKESEVLRLEGLLKETRLRVKRAEEELSLHKERRETLKGELDSLTQEIQDQETRLESIEEKAPSLEEKHLALISSLRDKEKGMELLGGDLSSVSAQKSRLEGAIPAGEERVFSLLKEKGELGKGLSELKNTREAIAIRIRETQERLAREGERLLGLEAKSLNKKRELEGLKVGLAGIERERAEAGLSLSRLTSRLEALEELEESDKRPKDLLDSPAVKGLFGGMPPTFLSEFIEVEEGYEKALDTALGEGLNAFVLERAESLLSQKPEDLPATPFIALDMASYEPPEPPPGTRSLLSRVAFPKGELNKPLAWVLGKTLLADDLKHALELYTKAPGRFQVVTPFGELITREGMISLGGAKGPGGLERKREIKELSLTVKETSEGLKIFEERRHSALSGLETLTRELKALEDEVSSAKKDLLTVEAELFRLNEEEKGAKGREETSKERLFRLDEEIKGLESSLKEHQKSLAGLKEKEAELREKVSEAKKGLERLKREAETLQGELSSLKMEEARAKERLSALLRDKERALKETGDIEGKVGRLSQDKTLAEGEIGSLVERLSALKGTLPQDWGLIKDKELRLSSQRESLSLESERLEPLEEEKTRITLRLKEVAKELKETELKLTEMEVGLKYMVTRGLEQLRVNLAEEGLAQRLIQGIPQEPEKRLGELSERMDSLGPVNLSAMDEYLEELKRFEFLSSQKDDLIEAKKGLEEAILRIDKEALGMLVSTLEGVNESLKGVFPLLFGGGSARLSFIDPKDLLDSGVEYLVKPPGKRLATLTLLSGGEKALAALALLFSFYALRPSPFLILDEAESGLDEANVARFHTLLERFCQDSQLIIITHNKKTMELAETLLGVTMEEPGISKMIPVVLERESTN